MKATQKLNYFSNKNGISKYYSPRMIIHQENIDYKCHCQFAFSEYVLGHDEPQPSNTNASQGLDCIYLCPTASEQGGHELLHF